MSFLDKVDFFRKSQQPYTVKSSLSGGLASVFCMTLVVVLALIEVDTYMTPYIEKTSKVAVDPLQQQRIKINLDIIFPNMPCLFIEPTIESTVNLIGASEITQNLTWEHIDSSQNVKHTLNQEKFEQFHADQAGSALSFVNLFYNFGEKCRIRGTISMLKVTSQLTFRQRGETELFKTLLAQNNMKPSPHDRFVIQMNHRVNSITFGEVSQQEHIARTFQSLTDKFHTLFNTFDVYRSEFVHFKSRDLLKETKQAENQDYYYFLKVVPHQFNDEINEESGSSYSYSLNHNQIKTEKRDESILAIIIDFAPIKVIINRRQREMGQLLVNLCAIISGVSILGGFTKKVLQLFLNKEHSAVTNQ